MDSQELGEERIELDDLLRMAHEAAMSGMHISCPAVVRSYDRTAGTVEVSLPVDRLLPDGQGGIVSEPMGSIKGVPIGLPRCRAMGITLPLAKDDTGHIIICERSISAWRAGKSGHPGDTDMHGLDGSVFYPGLGDEAHPPLGSSADNMTVGSETDAKGRIVYKPAGLELGAGATEAAVLGTSLASATSTLSTVLQTLNTAIGVFATAVGVATPAVAAAATTLNAAITAAATAISNYSTAVTNAKSSSTTVL